jgi:hypothetical protein
MYNKMQGTNDKPDCRACLPDLLQENQGVVQVYNVVCGQQVTESPFNIMDQIGIEKEDRLYCLNLIQSAWNEVSKIMRDKK